MTNKIDITKQYETRSGLPVRIYAVDCGGDYPVHGAYFKENEWINESFNEYGCSNNGYDDNFDDLIEVGTWYHIKIDDRVLVWNNGKENNKYKGHFAGLISSGGTNRPCIWDGRRTSYTETCKIIFDHCELYIEDKDNE
jgi:hypothetical protein